MSEVDERAQLRKARYDEGAIGVLEDLSDMAIAPPGNCVGRGCQGRDVETYHAVT